MKHTVKLFARASELAGRDEVPLELQEASRVADLRAALTREIPALTPLIPNLLIAVNAEYAADNTLITPDAEIACFSPCQRRLARCVLVRLLSKSVAVQQHSKLFS